MFEIIDELSILQKSFIEDIEVYSSKLNSIVNNIKSKTYDLLDHRRIDFDLDYEVFLKQIHELKVFYIVFFLTCYFFFYCKYCTGCSELFFHEFLNKLRSEDF